MQTQEIEIVRVICYVMFKLGYYVV